MKTEHFPSLDFCKKLTEIGFPRTENSIFEGVTKQRKEIVFYIETPEDRAMECSEGYLPSNDRAIKWGKTSYVCPSVAEMLDVIPDKIEPIRNDGFTFFYLEIGKKFVAYSNRSKAIKMTDGPIPNALAEMILWLHENNYISFSK